MSTTTKIQNYKVSRGSFGQYPAGSVLPHYAVALAGSVEEMVRRRIIEPTDAPVNVKLAPPRVQTTTTVPDETIGEINRLREECEHLAGDNRKLVAAMAAADQRVSAFQTEIGRYVEDNNSLRRVIEAKNEELRKLSDDYNRLGEQYEAARKDLEAATAPAPEAKTDDGKAKTKK
jgi:tetratricopeptide (TPR) repeat protein